VLVGGLSAQVVAAADEPGRLFFVVVAADATAPTAAEVWRCRLTLSNPR
jgi:hypothetical protein